jgi:hypothetical protein
MSSMSSSPRKQRDTWRGFFSLLCGLCGFLASECVMAQTPQAVDKSAEKLIGVRVAERLMGSIRIARELTGDGVAASSSIFYRSWNFTYSLTR